MNNPFIPLKNADTVIIAGNISEEIYGNLKKMNLRVIKTIPHKKVHSSIKYHPDIVIHPINNNILVTEPSVYEYYKEEFKNTNIEIIKGEKDLDCKYPLDIAYNVGRIANLAIHNFKYTDEVLKYYLKKQNLELINVNQGYTKCSIAIIGQNDIITSDTFIDKTLKKYGVNSLRIEPGDIFLEDQDYGFIGGCTGNISNKEVLFSGCIDEHPEKEKIEDFISNLNKKIVYLSKEKINDIGTIISLNCN
ncbi:DUF6873 family GME fold protein [Tissierella creatinophila]|uniref:DUF6873 domain-containing protein n=1 Tax=Tissierella creatinophila DSM 6911 TaxID=1123403 RepID=A0A1U7M6D5_TISCR|nr:hypothetical protein [Tissierella creatinophila]OLS02846.1 hypothetical protein TICRE_11960 [Tissierella creatinophila DSM 6911]